MSEGRSYYEGAADYDAETVRFFDVAHEGAHVRAVTEAASLLAGLEGSTPRSVVVLVTDAIAEAAAQCAVAVLGYDRAPVTVTRSLPEFVGALDVVIVVGDAPDAESATRQLNAAAGRGAEVILAGPAGGPVVEDASTRVIQLPTPPTALGASPLRTIAAIAAVITTLDGAVSLIDGLADAIDKELTGLSPERDVSVNSARQLREFIAGSRVLHTGYTPVGVAVAKLIATLWSARGLPSGFVGREDLGPTLEASFRNGDSAAESNPQADPNDIFYDPFIDGPPAEVPVKTIVWAQREPHLAGARAEYVEDDTMNSIPTAAGAHGADAHHLAAALKLIVRGLATTALN